MTNKNAYGWNPIISGFVDPPFSKYNPTLFAAESFLKRHRSNIKIVVNSYPSHLKWCDNWLCSNGVPLILPNICEKLVQRWSDKKVYDQAINFWKKNQNIEISRVAINKISQACHI
jgi:hypothetical protein